MNERTADVERRTSETEVQVHLAVDGSGRSRVGTGIPFFDHMLDLLARHGCLDLEVQARGDTQVDFHHTVEDVGICVGQALERALGDKAGIVRFGSASIPMGEARCDVALDLCGRFYLVWNVGFPSPKTGAFDTALVEDFFYALASNARLTLHVNVPYGRNDHHIAESVFKGVAHALFQAVCRDDRKLRGGVPSTKGVL
ncbi:MAG: imidazoleglycerol-phosphate dehydratase HisB [Planctomycetes bacterium]|nr:imidazoleglycerol-phosphate dehydratase HisB [Planctomycetota bacterium]